MSHSFQAYDDSWWPALRQFIETHWQPGHAITSQRLFNWQYQGFGPLADGRPKVFLSVDDGTLTGFVGAIPGLFKIQRTEGWSEEGGSFAAMWMVAPEHRRSGLGVYLMRHAIKEANILACLGMNDTAAKVYPALGIKGYLMMSRWVRPLGPGYSDLLKPSDLSGPMLAAAIAAWMAETSSSSHAAETITADPFQAERMHEVGPVASGLKRTEEFYRWRYVESPGFNYEWWSASGGVAIVRTETAAVTGGFKVLRLIELLAQPGASRAEFLRSVVARGVAEGCHAVDFQSSTSEWAGPLEEAGFRNTSPLAPVTALAEVFRPFRIKAAGINVAFRQTTPASDWCFLKSDGDMDRPNDPPPEISTT